MSSNGPKKIVIDEVQEHMMIPDYPHTKDSTTGILHIVHMKNPWQNDTIPDNPSTSSINNTFTNLMSHVCPAYAKIIQNTYFNRLNFQPNTVVMLQKSTF